MPEHDNRHAQPAPVDGALGRLSDGVRTTLGALGRIPAVHTSVLSYLEPLSAAVLGWVVLDETFGVGTVVGAALVVAGGLLVLGAPGAEEVVVSPEAAGTGTNREVASDVPG